LYKQADLQPSDAKGQTLTIPDSLAGARYKIKDVTLFFLVFAFVKPSESKLAGILKVMFLLIMIFGIKVVNE
jgi:hypothetical protein